FEIDNINNLDDEFLPHPNKYKKILKLLDETPEWKFEKWKKKVTSEFLNKFLNNFLQRKGDENLVEKNLNGWLKGEDPLSNQDKLKGYSLIKKPEQKIKVAKIKNSKFTGNINEITISGAE
ncbi:5916_t:CDS:2, partial [Cetraspora pellucida]